MIATWPRADSKLTQPSGPSLSAQVTEMFRSAPWASQVNVAGVPVRRLVDRQVRISLDGDGPFAHRRLVAETKAADQLLRGPQGHRVTEAVRGYLSLADVAEGMPARIDGLAFADTVRGVTLNTMISMVSDPGRSGLPFELRRDLDHDEIATLQDFVDAYHGFLKDSPDIALSPPFMSFGQNVTRSFLEHAGKDSSRIPASAQRQAFMAARTMAHELNHRITPADFTGMTPENAGVLQMAEEGSTELATALPGKLDAAARAMGMPAPPDAYRGPYGYPHYVHAFAGLLARAGIDVTSASDNERAYALLQGDASQHLPGRIADAIAHEHQVSATGRAALERAVTAIGKEAGPLDFSDEHSYGKWVQRFDEALTRQLAAIDSIIEQS